MAARRRTVQASSPTTPATPHCDPEYREARLALWARQADMAHALRKQARGHDCEDLAIDLTTLLLDVQRRQDADEARARKQRHAPPRQTKPPAPGRNVKSDPLADRGKKNRDEEERRKGTKTKKVGEAATSGNGRLEQTRKADKKKVAVLAKAKATWKSIFRLPHHQQKEEGADAPSS